MRRLCEEKAKSRRLEKKIFKDFYLNSSCGYKILSQNFEISVLANVKKKKNTSILPYYNNAIASLVKCISMGNLLH